MLNDPVNLIDAEGLDATVNLYKGSIGNPFGHIGIGINSPTTVGLYPKSGSLSDILSNYDVTGTVKSDFGKQLSSSIIIKTSPIQDKTMQNYLNQIMSDPGSYNLGGSNCATFVRHVLSIGGISSSDTIRPDTLMKDLQERYSK